jgi:Transposase DDE domain
MNKFYHDHLKNQLAPADLILLEILINILQSLKTVSLEKIAEVLPIPILFQSRRKKLQRFLSNDKLNVISLWLPIIKNWITAQFMAEETIYLVIDRTKWIANNLMMVSIIYKQRTIPIYFELLPQLGNSNLEQQKNVFNQVLPILKSYKIVVLGDREFCSVKLANWLSEQNVDFCLRLKKNEYILTNNESKTLNELGLKPGISLFFENVKVTKSKNIQGFNVAAKWKKSYRQISVTEGWFILTSLTDVKAAVAAYKKRFRIEEMFKDFKSSGYNLEATNVTGNRLISLILLIAFAYTQATIQGEKIKKKGVQKYICRTKEYGRLTNRHSSFHVGLYGENWAQFKHNCEELVEQLMRINSNKLEYYLRGMRAREIILSTL